MASGCLSHSKLPEIPGLESFAGPTYHTGHWPHEGVDFTGKRVGVIGTGSSGIQSIPIIAEQAAHLTVFQRTPNFSMPAQATAPLDRPRVERHEGATIPSTAQAARTLGLRRPGRDADEAALEVDRGGARRATTRRAGTRGTSSACCSAFTDLLVDKEANETAAEFVREQDPRDRRRIPQTAEKLCPSTTRIGTKRPCLDTGYYETFNRDNVTLVDLRETPIDEITPTGIRTTDERVRRSTPSCSPPASTR